MVSFSCENCGDVLTKKKLDSHRNQCRGAVFSCIDCMRTFNGTEYRSHTSCISEAQKYQGSLYKDKKKSQKPEESLHATDTSQMTTENPLLHTALVKMSTIEQETRESSLAIVDAPPRAPSPPPLPQAINVFDFLVKDDDDEWEDEDDMRLDRPNYNSQHVTYHSNGFAYGSGPIPAGVTRFNSHHGKQGQQNGNGFETPAQRKTRGKNTPADSSTAKKSSKRKFAHVDDLDLSKSGPSDVVMTDATPSGVMHSGLTGSINKLMSRAFPPSPDPSGDGNSPTSPVKRSRKDRTDKEHRREKKARRKSDSDKEKMEGSKRKKHKTDATTSKSKDGKKAHKHERRVGRRRSVSPGITKQHALSLSPPERHQKRMKAIEYHPSSEQEEDMSKALVKVEHAPTTKSVDTFLSCLVKGSDTDQGVSLWRALKRWRKQGGNGEQEKELWKELKIRSNERGELVICI